MLRNVVGSLDIIVDPCKKQDDVPSQEELDQAEMELHAMYARENASDCYL